MASHDLPSTTLKHITPEMFAKMSRSELENLLKATGFDLWLEIGSMAKAIVRSRKIKNTDKLKALLAIAQLVLKFEKTRSKEKGEDRPVYILSRSALTGPQNGPETPGVG
jgi:hypothetical protein